MTPQVISLSSLGSTAWIPVDYKQNPFNIGLACVVSNTPNLTYQVEFTLDDIFNTSITPTAFTHSLLVGKPSDFSSNQTVPVRAIRLTTTAYTSGTVTLTVLQGVVNPRIYTSNSVTLDADPESRFTARNAGSVIHTCQDATNITFSGVSGYAGAVDSTFPGPNGEATAWCSAPYGVGQGYVRININRNMRFASGDSISMRLYIEDPSSARYFGITLVQGANNLKRSVNSDGMYEAGGFGWYTITWKLSDFTVTGSPDYGSDWTLMELQFGGVSLGGGFGRFAVSNIRKNAGSCGYIIFSQDRAYDDLWTVKDIFAATGVPLTVFVGCDKLDTVGYLTTAQAQALKADPSGMFNLASYPDYQPTLGHTTNGIALSQAVAGAGNLVLAGSLCTAGVANLGAARKVTINTASGGGNRTVGFTITGSLAGQAVVETVLGSWGAQAVESRNYFDTVTQIAVSAALTGNVTAGTSYSVAEHAAAMAAQFAAVQAKGLASDSTGIMAYAGGQISEPLFAAMRQVGMVAGRTNQHSQTVPRNQLVHDAAFNPFLLSGVNLGTAIATLKLIVDDVKSRGGLVMLYFHEIAATVNGVDPTYEHLAEIIAYCKAYEEQGFIRLISAGDLKRIIAARAVV